MNYALAKCKGLTYLFFSEEEADIEYAKGICETCPLISECREQALVNGEAWGIWGGLGYPELRALAASRGLPAPSRKYIAHGTEAGFAWHRRRILLDPTHQICISCRLAYNNRQKERQADYRKRKEAQ